MRDNKISSKKEPLSDAPKILLLFAIFLIGVFAFIQVYSVQAILPTLISELNTTEIRAGLSVGATVMGIAIMSPFIGMLSDAIGRKIFIVGSLVFLSIPTFILALAVNIEQIIILRFLQGLVIPGITVVLIAYISEEFKPIIMAKLMSLYVAGTVLGGFLGRFILGHLNELIGWRNAFYIMGGLSIISAIFVYKQLPVSKNFIPKPNIKTAINTLINHLKNKSVVAACLLGACVLFSLVGCFTYINLYLSHEPYNLNTGQLANIFTVYLIGMLITPLSAKLIARFGSAKTIIMAIMLSMSGVLLTLSSPLAIIIIALTIMSSGVFITQAATISYIAANVSEGRSLASGLYYMSYYTGGTLGAWIGGIAFVNNGWLGIVYLLIFIQIIGLFIVFKLMKARG